MISLLDVEIQVLHFIQKHRLEELDSFLLFLTSSTTVVSILLSILFWWLISKEKKTTVPRMYPFSVILILSISSLISYILKASLNRPRPFSISTEIIQLTAVNTFSFPSGHTIAVTSILFGILFFYPYKRYIIPILIWALLVMYSRLALGVHFVTDVMAGVLLSFLVAFSVHLWMKMRIKILS